MTTQELPPFGEESDEQSTSNVIDMPVTHHRQRAGKQTTTGTVQEQLEERLKAFGAASIAVTKAARTFREELSVSFEACTTIIKTLQTMRTHTRACLELFEEGTSDRFLGLPSRFSLIGSLATLDGEHTARLILEMDQFRSLVLERYNESASHASRRISMHVDLQTDLAEEATSLKKVISDLELFLAELSARTAARRHP